MPSRAVFRKTPKGVDEVQHRSGKLTPRQRRILIMVDGKRTVEELRELASTTISPTSSVTSKKKATSSSSASKAKTRQSPAKTDSPPSPISVRCQNRVTPKNWTVARHFMINTIKAFCRAQSSISRSSTRLPQPNRTKSCARSMDNGFG